MSTDAYLQPRRVRIECAECGDIMEGDESAGVECRQGLKGDICEDCAVDDPRCQLEDAESLLKRRDATIKDLHAEMRKLEAQLVEKGLTVAALRNALSDLCGEVVKVLSTTEEAP